MLLDWIKSSLEPNLSEDGIAGFDFLGHNVRQFSVGKHKSAKFFGKSIGFVTLIKPSKTSCKKHQIGYLATLKYDCDLS